MRQRQGGPRYLRIIDCFSGAALEMSRPSNIATEFVAASTPDGYTLFIPVSTNAINATLYKNQNFDFVRDLAPVGRQHWPRYIRTGGDAVIAGQDPSRIHRLPIPCKPM